MKIFAVSEPYEAPCAYFATREGAEAYVADCEAYYQEWRAWSDSDASDTENFVPSDRFTEVYYPMDELFIDEVEVR